MSGVGNGELAVQLLRHGLAPCLRSGTASSPFPAPPDAALPSWAPSGSPIQSLLKELCHRVLVRERRARRSLFQARAAAVSEDGNDELAVQCVGLGL